MRGQGQGGDVTSLEDGSKRAGILRVPVVEQIPAILKEAPSVHGYVPCHLLHPAVSRMDGDPSDVYLAAFDVDEEQNIEGHQSTKGEDLHTEEVGSCEDRQVRTNERCPCRRVLPLRGRAYSMTPQDVSHGLV